MSKRLLQVTFLFLSVLCLIIFSFKDRVYSTTNPSSIPLESNPLSIAINPITDIAVVISETEGHGHHSENSGVVSVIDLNTQTVISTIPVGKEPKGVAIDTGLNLALVSNSNDDTVSVIDLNTYKVIRTIKVGKSPEGIAVNPSNSIALVANHKDDTVSVIDLLNFSVMLTIPVGKEPKDIAIDPEINIALLVNEKEKEDEESENEHKHGKEDDDYYAVSVIDLNTYQVTGEVPVGKKPQAIDINPETHLAAVANEKDNSITVIDPYSDWKTTTILVCKHPIDIAINQLDNRALVICSKDRVLQLSPPLEKGEGGGFYYPLNKEPKGVAVNNFTNIAGVIDDKTDSLTLIQLPNPISEIISINPSTVYRGSTGESIAIEGNKFIKTSKVHFENQILETTFIDNHNLEVKIPKDLLLKAGTYQITVTNPAPEGGTSNPINLQINNPIPSIAMLDPAQTMAGTLSLTLTVYGTGFFDDTTVYINGISRPFNLLSQTKLQIELTSSDLETGKYLEVTASNPPPGGGLSNKAVVTVLNPVPILSSINPDSIIAGSPDFTLTITGNNFVKTSIVSFNNHQFPARYISKTLIETTIPSDAIKTPGSYPVKVINPAPGGGESSSLTFTVKPPLEIKITSPTDGETINKAKTLVKGTFRADTSDVGINVNGIIAEIIGNEWIANNVPLAIGTNPITATIKDSLGNSASASIMVNTTDITQQVELSANITSGIPPLQVFFSVSTSFIPVSYQMDFEGDGVIDYTGATFENISHTYTSEGIFYPILTVTDDQGNTYSDTIAVTVLNKTEIDTLLKGKWEGMKEELKQKDIDKALDYFIEQSKERYRKVFEALKEQLPMIVDTFVEFNIVNVYDYIAEYEIVANENGILYSYPGLLIKDESGIWKFKDF